MTTEAAPASDMADVHIAAKEKKLSPATLKKQLRELLLAISTYVEGDDQRVGLYIAATLQEIVKYVSLVADQYRLRLTDGPIIIANPREFEDEAFDYFSLGMSVVALLEEINKTLDSIAAVAARTQRLPIVSHVITPPSEVPAQLRDGTAAAVGSKNSEPTESVLRLQQLLLLLMRSFNLTSSQLDALEIVRGLEDEVISGALYYRVAVTVKEKRRIFYVCNDYGNATYVFDAAKVEAAGITLEELDSMTKPEKDELIADNNGIGKRIIYRASWHKSIVDCLQHDLDDRIVEKRYDRQPEEAEKKGEWKGWYISPDGQHYASIAQLAARLQLDPGKFAAFRALIALGAFERVPIKRNTAIIYGYPLEAIEVAAAYRTLTQERMTEGSGEWSGFYILLTTLEDGTISESHWANLVIMSNRLKISRDLLEKWISANHLQPITVLYHGTARRLAAFSYEEICITEEYQTFAALAESKQVWFIAEDGKKWGSIAAIAKELKHYNGTIKEIIAKNGLSNVERIIRGHRTQTYCLDDVKQILAKNAETRQLDCVKYPETQVTKADGTVSKGFYIDDEGRIWGSVRAMADLLDLSTSYLYKLIGEKVLTVLHIEKNLHPIQIVCREEIMSLARVQAAKRQAIPNCD